MTRAKRLSKAKMARDERKWAAERLVLDGVRDTPEFRKAVKAAEHHLAEGEKAARAAITKR